MKIENHHSNEMDVDIAASSAQIINMVSGVYGPVFSNFGHQEVPFPTTLCYFPRALDLASPI